MGNTSSCKVITSNGRALEFTSPVRASALTGRNPGQFVCDSSQLSVGCRIPGLASEDELEANHLYFLLPMDLLYSVLTEDEMASLTRRASSKRCKTKSYIGRRIFPVLSDFCWIPAEAKKIEEELERSRVKEETGDVQVWRQRSWQPALDTIDEASSSP